MRLMNTKTHQLEVFDSWDTVPPYAILSHTWELGEVLFNDVADGPTETKLGWSKILGACAEAEKLGIFYVWIDTCCIFKESSAELSESINSMFAWYRSARICFAYLGDLEKDLVEGRYLRRNMKRNIEESKWWTRGWTLQELIAPREVMFFDTNWIFIDLRSSLAEPIAKITGVAEEILRSGNLDKLHGFSIAQKLSWAASRMTTRAEDRAYSLMGLFGVSMSMIYGEGEQAAFFRLQKEIFAVYADHRIFAWQSSLQTDGETNQRPKLCDLLAPSVSDFKYSVSIINEPYDWSIIGRPKLDKVKVTSTNKPFADYSAISHGMRIQMLLQTNHDNYYIAYLACRFHAKKQTLLTIVLELEASTGQYRRVSSSSPDEYKIDHFLGSHATLQDIYIAAPRLDFAMSLMPTRHQMGRLNVFNSYAPFLTLMDSAVYEADFTPVDYSPPKTNWEPAPWTSHAKALPVLRLWHNGRDSSVIYRHKKTAESFAVVTGTNKKFRSMSIVDHRFHAAIVDDVGPDTSASHVLGNFFEHNSHALTDLSTQMLVKRLSSGNQVIISVSVSKEKGSVFQTLHDYFNFRLWVVVKQVRA